MGAHSWHSDLDSAFCSLLASHGYYVVMFDNRDVGRSTKLHHLPVMTAWTLVRFRLGLAISAPYTVEDLAHDTLALMDALELSAVHLVGSKMRIWPRRIEESGGGSPNNNSP